MKMHDLDDLVSPSQVAERLHVTRTTVGNWRARYDDFPAPLIQLGTLPVYSWAELVRWYAGKWPTEAVRTGLARVLLKDLEEQG